MAHAAHFKLIFNSFFNFIDEHFVQTFSLDFFSIFNLSHTSKDFSQNSVEIFNHSPSVANVNVAWKMSTVTFLKRFVILMHSQLITLHIRNIIFNLFWQGSLQ